MSLKQKNIGLLLGFILLLWITYQFSISKTIVLKNNYYILLNQKTLLSNVPQQINYLKQQNQYYDSILEVNKITSKSTFQNNLLQVLNSFAIKNQLKIIAFNEPHEAIKNETILKTYSFTVKGSFIPILQLLNNLEQSGNFGKMISINFNKNKNYKTNKQFLECSVFLQRIEGTEN